LKQKIVVGIFTLTLMALLVCASGFEEDEPQPEVGARVEAWISRDTLTVGDTLTVTLSATLPLGAQLLPFEQVPDLAPFVVRQVRLVMPDTLPDGSLRTGWDIEMALYLTGEHAVPPVELSIIEESGDTNRISSDSIPVVVMSVLPEDAQGLMPLKKQIRFPAEPPPWLWGILAAIPVIVGLVLLDRRRRVHRGVYVAPQEPILLRSPHEIAYDELDRLAAMKLWEKGMIKRYYTELSEVIRRYVSGRYHIITMERTTSEVVDQLQGRGVERSHVDAFATFLWEADLVKFAKRIPSDEEMQEVLVTARRLVDETKREPVEESSELQEVHV
jgi:hypothetical protein